MAKDIERIIGEFKPELLTAVVDAPEIGSAELSGAASGAVEAADGAPKRRPRSGKKAAVPTGKTG